MYVSRRCQGATWHEVPAGAPAPPEPHVAWTPTNELLQIAPPPNSSLTLFSLMQRCVEGVVAPQCKREFQSRQKAQLKSLVGGGGNRHHTGGEIPINSGHAGDRGQENYHVAVFNCNTLLDLVLFYVSICQILFVCLVNALVIWIIIFFLYNLFDLKVYFVLIWKVRLVHFVYIWTYNSLVQWLVYV